MSLSHMLVKSKIRDYKVYYAQTADFISKLANIPDSLFIVDHKVWEYYADSCLNEIKNLDLIVLPIGEEEKTLETVQKLYDQIMKKSPKRNMTIISIGGGIAQDITGFLASTLYRGVNWIFVPTTLLAQADSCIGAKTSLNYKSYKNLIGTFYPPSEVYICTEFLLTQNPVDFYSGVGEIAKLNIMSGENNTFEFINNLSQIVNMDKQALLKSIKKALAIKQNYIEEDEFDAGKRNMLNYGHCFGHAIESVTNFEIPHGQAVVLGMLLANIVAQQRKLLSPEKENFLAQKALIPVIKVNMKDRILDSCKMIEAMKNDKKNTGLNLALVMITDQDKLIKVNDLTQKEVNNALLKLREYF